MANVSTLVVNHAAAQAGSSAESPALWNDGVLAALCALSAVRVVVFTNQQGLVIHTVGRAPLADKLGKVIDVAAGALSKTGERLELGQLRIGVSIYDQGVIVLARSAKLNVGVIAEAEANLGALLNHVRRIFVQEGAS